MVDRGDAAMYPSLFHILYSGNNYLGKLRRCRQVKVISRPWKAKHGELQGFSVIEPTWAGGEMQMLHSSLRLILLRALSPRLHRGGQLMPSCRSSSSSSTRDCYATARSCHTETCHLLLQGSQNTERLEVCYILWRTLHGSTSGLGLDGNVFADQPFLLLTGVVVLCCIGFLLCFCVTCNKGPNAGKQSAWLSYLRRGFIFWSCTWLGLCKKNTRSTILIKD